MSAILQFAQWFLYVTERLPVTGIDWSTLRNLLKLLGQFICPFSCYHIL